MQKKVVFKYECRLLKGAPIIHNHNAFPSNIQMIKLIIVRLLKKQMRYHSVYHENLLVKFAHFSTNKTCRDNIN